MAESCDKAFGRYLRTLRERRQLTLDDVASLSNTFPDSISKGYLSRCENGHQKPAFSKVIALSRIYEVPADVLVERMELDMELERVGGPETRGMDYHELTLAGKDSLHRGSTWNSYAYLRDAVLRAMVDSVSPSFRDPEEQNAIAHMSCASAAKALGRVRYALHEFLYLHDQSSLGQNFRPIILERLSGCYRTLRQLDDAESYGDSAVAAGQNSDDKSYLGFVYANRAYIAWERSQLDIAVSLFSSAYNAYKEAGHSAECVSSLNNLSQCYFDLGRFRTARRTCEAALKLGRAASNQKSVALSLIMLGELDEIDGKIARAVARWKEAVDVAKMLKDRSLRFKAEFVLYRRARRDENRPVERAIRRRLLKLAPSLPPDLHELESFKQMLAG